MVLVSACASQSVIPGKNSVSQVQAYDRVDEDLRSFDAKVFQMNNEFAKIPSDRNDIKWVKKKLQHMVDVDQYMRKFMTQWPYEKNYKSLENEYFDKEFRLRFKQVDSEHTQELKALIKTYQWFRISQFGKEADQNAWLLVQHADEQPEFQKEILTTLSVLYKAQETKPENYAYLYDRVAASFFDLSQRKLQRYGTQGACTGPGTWAPIPIEEPALVDARRASVGLGTMAEYISVFKEICR